MNGEPREVAGRIMISCFLTPERSLKNTEDKCVLGSWKAYTRSLSLNMPVTLQWGEWDQ